MHIVLFHLYGFQLSYGDRKICCILEELEIDKERTLGYFWGNINVLCLGWDRDITGVIIVII